MRILHTSDWHLGHALHEHSRAEEHREFLRWLLALLEAERADALLIAGDVFDAANPPASALAAWYDFLASARRRFPRLGIVAIGGNHDSPARLDAANPVLRSLDVHVVGGMPVGPGGDADLERIVVPLEDADGGVGAWCVAMPFLRPADLPPGGVAEGADPLVAGVRALYDRALDLARSRRTADEPLVAMGHCYMTGTRLSETSERKILGGNQHALPVDLFPEDVSYAALGHLHLAQSVGGRESIRYCGSPIPLSFAETSYPHQVLVVDVEAGAPARARAVHVPRAVEILRVPERGAGPLDEVLTRLRALPSLDEAPEAWTRPLLEVRVRIAGPEPDLRSQVEAALQGKAARLLRIAVERDGDGRALGDAVPGATLRDLSPEDVFLLRCAQEDGGEPPEDLLAAFHELLDAVRREGAT